MFNFSKPKHNRIFNRAMFGNSTVRQIAVKKMKESSYALIREQVVRSIEQGIIRSGVNVDLVSYLLNLIMSDIINYINESPVKKADKPESEDSSQIIDESKLRDVISNVTNIIENGIKPK